MKEKIGMYQYPLHHQQLTLTHAARLHRMLAEGLREHQEVRKGAVEAVSGRLARAEVGSGWQSKTSGFPGFVQKSAIDLLTTRCLSNTISKKRQSESTSESE